MSTDYIEQSYLTYCGFVMCMYMKKYDIHIQIYTHVKICNNEKSVKSQENNLNANISFSQEKN